MKLPNLTFGVFTQKGRYWPGVGFGPLDDCWILADTMGVHATDGSLPLVGAKAYRAAAGVPDTATGSEGGSLEASLKAINALWPSLHVELFRGTWTDFVVKATGRAFSGSVKSASLPNPHGFVGSPSNHRIAGVLGVTDSEILNPLADPHSKPERISNAQLRKAFVDYPNAAEVCALIFPAPDDAANQAAFDAGVLAGRRAEWDRQKAGATVALLPKL